MIVYVEAVILDNFCFDFLLGYLTYLITKQKPRYLPITLSAVFGCVAALIYPLARGLGIWIKLPVLFICALLLTMRRSFRGYLINTFVYALLTFLLSGIITFLLGGKMGDGFIGIKWGGVVAVVSLATFLLLYAVRQTIGLIGERKRREKFATAELIGNGKSIKINALFDSGNLLTDENGDGVVVTDGKRLEALGALKDIGELHVHTASGSKVLKLVKIPEIRIYSKQGENILTNVTAALSDLPKEYALILPCD